MGVSQLPSRLTTPREHEQVDHSPLGDESTRPDAPRRPYWMPNIMVYCAGETHEVTTNGVWQQTCALRRCRFGPKGLIELENLRRGFIRLHVGMMILCESNHLVSSQECSGPARGRYTLRVHSGIGRLQLD